MNIDRESQLAHLRHREQLHEALQSQAARAALQEESRPMYFAPHTSSWGLLRISAIVLLALALAAYTYQAAAPQHRPEPTPAQGQLLAEPSGNAPGNDWRMNDQ